MVVEILYKPSKVPGCGLSQLLPVDINEQTDKSMCVGGSTTLKMELKWEDGV